MIGIRAGIRPGIKCGIAAGISADPLGSAVTIDPGLILIWGQSNAIGIANQAALSPANAGYAAPYPAVNYSVTVYNGVSDPLVAAGPYANGALKPISNGGSNMGVELSLGRDLDIASGGKIAIAKYAVNGADLANQWLATGTFPSTTQPPNLFNLAMNHAAAAATAFSKPVSCLVWIQGETDAITTGPANAYQANLTALFAAFRAVYPKAAIVVLQISTVAAETYVNTVRGAMATVVAATAKAAMVDASDLPLFTTYHYNADGLIDVGHRLATAIKTVVGLHADFTYVSTGLSTTFTDASTALVGTVVSWSWNFGDGSTSASQNPVHVYAANGAYNVTLTVGGSNGRTSTSAVSQVTVTTTWVVDATSNKALPRNAAEYTLLLAAAGNAHGNPSLLWNLQQAGGVAVDAIGTFTGSIVGQAGSLFRQSVPGWTTKGVAIADDSNVSFVNTDAGIPDLSATSLLVIGYAVVSAPASLNQILYKTGTTTNTRTIIRTGTVRVQGAHGANSATGTVVPTGAVRPFVMRHNFTAGTAMFCTDQEKLVPTFSATTTGKNIMIADNSHAAPATHIMLAAWFGAAAEWSDAEVKTFLQTAGWTILW